MKWNVRAHRKASKKMKKLPTDVRSSLLLLMRDLQENGPKPKGNWKNYSKLKGSKTDKRHCHICKGKPTYVCCWEVIDNELRILEVYYAGTHEKAPY